jgi:hypothetical protein
VDVRGHAKKSAMNDKTERAEDLVIENISLTQKQLLKTKQIDDNL